MGLSGLHPAGNISETMRHSSLTGSMLPEMCNVYLGIIKGIVRFEKSLQSMYGKVLWWNRTVQFVHLKTKERKKDLKNLSLNFHNIQRRWEFTVSNLKTKTLKQINFDLWVVPK